MSDTIHVYPTNDLVAHDLEDDGCPCGPDLTLVQREDGAAWLVKHHALDGRA